MLRAFLARIGLTALGEQLELSLGAPRTPSPVTPRRRRADDERRMPVQVERAEDAVAAPDALLERLRAFGMSGIGVVRLTRNRTTLVSFGRSTLRMHEAFASAPEEVQRAIATFVSGRGAARKAARRIILEYRVPRSAPPPVRRREATHPDDRAMADRLTREHARLNAQLFADTLRAVEVRVSRRMKTRLGHYAPGGSVAGDIVISRRHIRRHGWEEAFATLLHEMVHQWQEESGLPLDHGPAFRRKAREVGVVPRARRALR